MNTVRLYINEELLDSYAKDRFLELSNDETVWNDVKNRIKEYIEPKGIYKIYKNISKTEDGVKVLGVKENEINLKSSVIKNMPDEIVGAIAVIAASISEDESKKEKITTSQEILDDMGKLAYLDALKKLIYIELQEEYLVGPYFAPGLSDIKISEIIELEKLLNIREIGITINEHHVMLPEKSVFGFYIIFNEAHPVSANSCETCMARGHGCNFCSVEGEKNV